MPGCRNSFRSSPFLTVSKFKTPSRHVYRPRLFIIILISLLFPIALAPITAFPAYRNSHKSTCAKKIDRFCVIHFRIVYNRPYEDFRLRLRSLASHLPGLDHKFVLPNCPPSLHMFTVAEMKTGKKIKNACNIMSTGLDKCHHEFTVWLCH
uniref:Uncharacterized protein n=1 Tax=Glossina palpalis gambiensis TaxID=67801 RepID=A0A1B0BVI0_9MUSC